MRCQVSRRTTRAAGRQDRVDVVDLCAEQRGTGLPGTVVKSKTDPARDIEAVMDPSAIAEARRVVDEIYIDGKIKDYIVDLVFATREPAAYSLELDDLIEYGASPRATRVRAARTLSVWATRVAIPSHRPR